ncbi:MAG: helix-turn-helix transcriptional regulator [Candidatus Omnitrophica bacterium]|nr:helix-turn-helix transcriptional regulator [Candidatus Omnitrophota bacterium]
MNYHIINLQIKDLRKKLGLTQVDFAKRAEIGLRFLRELERGKTTVRLDKLNKVLDFLGYHLELKRNEPEKASGTLITKLGKRKIT